MSARRLATLAIRGCEGAKSRCRNALPQIGGSLLDDSQPSTSASCSRLPGLPSNQPHSSGWSAAHMWLSQRYVHHDHQHCDHRKCNHDKHQHRDKPRRTMTLEEVEKACWSCEKLVKRGGLVCHGCETVQPPDESLNYFELFQLPAATFDLDPALLERRYKALQWNLHPDRLGRKPAEERTFSTQQASLINLAYSILKTPLSRANYLLALRGINAGDSFQGTIEDPELLMEVLEAREEVEGTEDPATLSALLTRNRAQQERLVAQLLAAFRADDTAAAVGLTHQLQYLAKLEQEIVKKMPQL